MISDSAQRETAIDVRRSCIVQAPAGSGKTELLIQRYLALLGVVERPGQILAITFTRKAAAEMRNRIVQALEGAQQPRPEKSHEAKTWELAGRALLKQGAELLRNPGQLAIQTIDSFNASLVRKMPWLSRFGALPAIVDDAEPLYRQAVTQVLDRLDGAGAGSDQVRQLLAHLDNQVGRLQELLIDLLQRRDQWLRHLLRDDPDPRATLETGLRELVGEQLSNLCASFPGRLQAELFNCLRYAAANLEEPNLSHFAETGQLPGMDVEDLPYWQLLADFLLAGNDELRKTVNKNQGFPAGVANQEAKQQMLGLLQEFSATPEFISQLVRIRQLPGGSYAEKQWSVLQMLVELLPLLVGELWLVFRSRGGADYAEIALKAKQALGSAENPGELLLHTDNDLRHILVDEFQDTSWLQYELLITLTSGWSEGDGRSLFLVGDPMQSIYRFREAEVGLFLKTFAGRLGGEGPQLTPLQLISNFRSQAGLVKWVNRGFRQIFPGQVDIASGAVPLADAAAVHPELPGPACRLHPFADRNDQAEAELVLQLVRQAFRENPEQRVAILVRGRNHLQEILPLLRRNGLRYQAQDIEQLGVRPAVLDLVGLCRAILHRADRLAWLTVLRAPWCGLSLADLHALVEESPERTIPALLEEETRLARLSPAGRETVNRVWPLLQRAIARCGRLGLRELIEGTWLVLGGPACYDAEGCEDAQLFFGLLESLEQGGGLPDFGSLEQGLKKLYAAPDTEADGKLQVMTIHKAKGLEFDTVIIPGLGKAVGSVDSPLLRWLEHPDYGLLLAPLAERGSGEQDPIYRLIGQLEKEKQDLETARLLYVATTRAISSLHLIGHADSKRSGELKPATGSLLEKLWPLVKEEFAGAAGSSRTESAEYAPPILQRLPSDWQGPTVTAVSLPAARSIRTASEKDEAAERDLIFSGWEQESRRHVGTLVHQQLERLARSGAEVWTQLEDGQRQLMLDRQLQALGVPASELSGSRQRVVDAVELTLASERGRWLLGNHPQQASELPLSGLVGGQLIHAIIDRTFVADGERWIIDYKTSTPKTGESLAVFLHREAEQYRQQLIAYARLFSLRRENLPIRAALYFPLVDGWCELEVADAPE